MMGKNYFTDEQIVNIAIDAGFNEPYAEVMLKDLKSLMNLAVETAIGEPVGIFKGEFGGDVNRNMWFKSKAIGALPKLGAELHSIQELDS